METNPKHLIHSFNNNPDSQGNYEGLTKLEHMAIEFCKALVSAQVSNEEGNAIIAIRQAKELIKQLNKTQS